MRSALQAVLTFALCAAGIAGAAEGSGAGKIYCWKNAAGKSECGDRPPQDAATRELTREGITKQTKEAALTPEQQKAREEEEARKKVEKARYEQQLRRDRALLETFTNEQEIDAKRKRELAGVEAQVTTLETTLRNANERQIEAQRRAEEYRKNSGKIPPAIQDEVTRIDQEKLSLNAQLAKKRQEIVEINATYAQMRKRFTDLKNGAAAPGSIPPTPPTPPAPAGASATVPAPAPPAAAAAPAPAAAPAAPATAKK
jgi:hypothetical protein